MNDYIFRKAKLTEVAEIWLILQQAILRRKADGSNQWQDGYPNPEVIQNDIQNGHGFVFTDRENILGYVAILINDEPEYDKIVGKWLTNADFVVFHRIAIADAFIGKGIAIKMFECIKEFALSHHIFSIKADTNFDNHAMLHLFEKTGYQYCGEVYFRGSPRKAYELVINKDQKRN